jgi:hypothetical protein
MHLILENGMKDNSIIVTSICNDKAVYDLIGSSGIKILPKHFISNIGIVVES